MVRRRSIYRRMVPYPVVTEKPSSIATPWNHRQLMAPGGLLFAPDLTRLLRDHRVLRGRCPVDVAPNGRVL